MAIQLQHPVGDLSRTSHSGNLPRDVASVTQALAVLDPDFSTLAHAEPAKKLTASIRAFQQLAIRVQDGRIDPGGRTLRALNALASGRTIVVSLKRQVLLGLQDLRLTHTFHCTSGDIQHPTPPGLYKIERKERIYRSRTYDAQMNYAMFFHRGYAIHQSEAVTLTSFLRAAGVEYFGSHGCVRLEESQAQRLFDWSPMGTDVLIWPQVRF